MVYTRPHSRREAALSRARRSHKFSATDRGVLGVHDGRECVGTIVLVGFDMVEAVERPFGAFDQDDRRVSKFGSYRGALRAGPRGRAS
jgi:hypothetical protein